MLVGDLIQDFNWSTPAMFYKFYFMQTEHPGRPVSVPARTKDYKQVDREPAMQSRDDSPATKLQAAEGCLHLIN